MVMPLYQNSNPPPTPPPTAHAGLWYDRFFDRYESDWSVQEEKRDPKTKVVLQEEGKRAWINTVVRQRGTATAIEGFVRRQAALVAALGGISRLFATDWRFATGLGYNHPVENGFAWHLTLGTPYLAASGVKGLLRHWVTVWDGAENDPRLPLWFGTQDQAGALIFFDAVPARPVSLVADVMTPHMGKWYESGGGIEDVNAQPHAVPADWHDPVPVPFLTVGPGAQFFFSIAPRKAVHAALVEPAMATLEQALEWLGAGAKTAVGYGRMRPDPAETERLRQRHGDHTEQQRQREAEAERLAKLDPLDREIAEATKSKPDLGMPDYAYLIQIIERGAFGDKRRAVAERIRGMMQTAGVWEKAKKPKDRDRVNIVKQWLGEA